MDSIYQCFLWKKIGYNIGRHYWRIHQGVTGNVCSAIRCSCHFSIDFLNHIHINVVDRMWVWLELCTHTVLVVTLHRVGCIWPLLPKDSGAERGAGCKPWLRCHIGWILGFNPEWQLETHQKAATKSNLEGLCFCLGPRLSIVASVIFHSADNDW